MNNSFFPWLFFPRLILLPYSSLVPHLPSVWTAVSSSGAWAVGQSHWFVQWGGIAEVVQSSWIPQRLQQLFPEFWNPIKLGSWMLQGGSAVKNTRYSPAWAITGTDVIFLQSYYITPLLSAEQPEYTCVSYRFWRQYCCLATCLFCPRQHGWAKPSAAVWPP